MYTVKKFAKDLEIGDVCVLPASSIKYTLRYIQIIGKGAPYLIFQTNEGKRVDHDTALDTLTDTYDVLVQ